MEPVAIIAVAQLVSMNSDSRKFPADQVFLNVIYRNFLLFNNNEKENLELKINCSHVISLAWSSRN